MIVYTCRRLIDLSDDCRYFGSEGVGGASVGRMLRMLRLFRAARMVKVLKKHDSVMKLIKTGLF